MARSTTINALAVLLTSLFAANAYATPVVEQRYRFDIVLECFRNVASPDDSCIDADQVGDTELGKVYSGEFSIDASLLATDGWVNSRPLSFYFSTGGYGTFDPTLPEGVSADGLHRNSWSGYHGHGFSPAPDDPTLLNSWSFHVQNGEIDRFCCYINGDTDSTGVDFFLSGNQFGPQTVMVRGWAGIMDFGEYHNVPIYYNALGTFMYYKVPAPEPSSLALFALGCIGVGLARRRRKGQSAVAP